ncbi:uncharacterized protein [Nicotiana tomentosiformis]|uniref:uncharacterized protein n=1 Tax=Nicotiana tomentosiformis TaxID=4098 RepID=UPI00388C93A5
MVEEANYRARAPVAAPGTARLSTEPLLSSVYEKPTSGTAFAAVASQPTMPSASSPSLPPVTTTSSSPTMDVREEEIPHPHSPVHGNLANFLAFEGLQRLILNKEKLTSERDQLLAERDLIDARLLELEAKDVKAVELEARLQQIDQEVVTLSQETALLKVQFQEAKAKWSEVQNDVIAVVDREVASAKRINNLEAALNSKVEEAAVAEEKHARMEEKYKKVMEHNKFCNSTINDLVVSLQAARSERNNLSIEVDQLKEELQYQTTSLIVEKTYSMYNMRRKTLEEAKRISKFSRTEEEPEGDNDEGQDLDSAADPPTSPGGADVSLPPDSGDAAVELFLSFLFFTSYFCTFAAWHVVI